MELRHGIIGTLKPHHSLSFAKRTISEVDYPKAFCPIASFSLATIALAVFSLSSTFLQSHNGILFGDEERKRKIGEGETVLPLPGCKHEEVLENNLSVMVNTTRAKETVESTLAVSIRWLQMLQLVVRQPKWLHAPIRDSRSQLLLGDGVIEQTVTDEVDKQVFVHPRLIVLEKVWMFLDEAYDIIDLLLRRLKTPPTTSVDDELISWDLPAVTAKADERGIFQAVSSVELIASILQHILNTNFAEKVIVGQATTAVIGERLVRVVSHESIIFCFISYLSSKTPSISHFVGNMVRHGLEIAGCNVIGRVNTRFEVWSWRMTVDIDDR